MRNSALKNAWHHWVCALALGMLVATGIAAAQTDAARAAFEKEDYALAYRLYLPAAESGGAEAQYRVGMMRKFGWGAEKNYVESARWLRAAAEQSHGEAQAELGRLYKDGRGVAESQGDAARWFRLAAEQGVGIAQLNLGRMYKDGQGVTKDPVEAWTWFTLAAQNGYVDGLSLRARVAEVMSPDEVKDAEQRAKSRSRPAAK